MRIWVKGIFFLSAYFPLFLILTILNPSNPYLLALFLFNFIVSSVSWISLINSSRRINSHEFRIITSENKLIDSLNYLIPYLISFMEFEPKVPQLIALLILLTILFIIYADTNLIFVNPMLAFFGYRIFLVEVEDISSPLDFTQKFSILLLSKRSKEHKKGIMIKTKRLTEDFHYEVR